MTPTPGVHRIAIGRTLTTGTRRRNASMDEAVEVLEGTSPAASAARAEAPTR